MTTLVPGGNAPVATGQVELVMHADTGVVQTEFPCISGLPQGAGIQTLALGADASIHLGIQCRTRPRRIDFLRLPQGGFGRSQRWAGLKSLFDQRIELG